MSAEIVKVGRVVSIEYEHSNLMGERWNVTIELKHDVDYVDPYLYTMTFKVFPEHIHNYYINKQVMVTFQVYSQ